MKIKQPTLLVDKIKVTRNIDNMIKRANHFNAELRPHFKTHQSAEIGELFKNRGIKRITVSSVSMAEYFTSHGWKDITIAFPANLLQLNEISNITEKINLNILVDSLFSVKSLSTFITHRLGIFIKIDTGYHRSGLLYNSDEIEKIVNEIRQNKFLVFEGFLTHAGHTYNAKGKVGIERIVDNSLKQLSNLKNIYPETIISWGDTPSCSISENLYGFDELRPGNFVYYDVMQYHIGSCKINEIAVAVACPIVSVYPERGELILYGGAVHLSKEFIAADNDFKLYGYVAQLTESKNGRWEEPIPGAWVSSLSQEHAVVKMPKEKIEEFRPGDLLCVLPIHSCLSANLLKQNTLIF